MSAVNGNGVRDWKLIAIALLLGSSGGGLGHGLLTQGADEYRELAHKIDRHIEHVDKLADSLKRVDRRVDRVETYQQYVVKPRLEKLHP